MPVWLILAGGCQGEVEEGIGSKRKRGRRGPESQDTRSRSYGGDLGGGAVEEHGRIHADNSRNRGRGRRRAGGRLSGQRRRVTFEGLNCKLEDA